MYLEKIADYVEVQATGQNGQLDFLRVEGGKMGKSTVKNLKNQV